MTGDDSLALDSIASDYRFVLEHDVSMLEIALAAVSFEDCSLAVSMTPFHWIGFPWHTIAGLKRWKRFILAIVSADSVFRMRSFQITVCLNVCC